MEIQELEIMGGEDAEILSDAVPPPPPPASGRRAGSVVERARKNAEYVIRKETNDVRSGLKDFHKAFALALDSAVRTRQAHRFMRDCEGLLPRLMLLEQRVEQLPLVVGQSVGLARAAEDMEDMK